MADSNFAKSLSLILEEEGGWSDHPDDKGGATMNGITIATYSAWLKRPATKDELRNIPKHHIHEIYYKNYWLAAHCHKMPAGLDFMVFDMAVNFGVSAAVKNLQRTLGLTQDGKFGPVSQKAVDTKGTHLDTFIDFTAHNIVNVATY